MCLHVLKETKMKISRGMRHFLREQVLCVCAFVKLQSQHVIQFMCLEDRCLPSINTYTQLQCVAGKHVSIHFDKVADGHTRTHT